jgi:glycerol-3-phosphate dehydrogenase (NAD(P)+)
VTRAAVLSAGSWGTVFAKVIADAGGDAMLLSRSAAVVEAVNERRRNPTYVPGVVLPSRVRATLDPREALRGADLVVLAIPSQALREALAGWAPEVDPHAIYVSLMKGIETGTSKRMTEVIGEVTGVEPERVALVSGPNLAAEIGLEQPSATVVASVSHSTALTVQAAAHTAYLRPYTNTDVIGCELGGAVKNVIALAAGMVTGMGYGANAVASLITRGLAETARLGSALGADPLTFAGLAGLGDLVATCTSPLSRNRTFGEKLGRGMTLEQVTAEQFEVAEGVRSCPPLLHLARRHDVDMPIIEHVELVIYEGLPVADALKSLMSRDPGPE